MKLISKTYYNYKEIEAFVFENEEALKKATLRELYEFARDNGFNSGMEFNLYKQALSEIGINDTVLRLVGQISKLLETAALLTKKEMKENESTH